MQLIYANRAGTAIVPVREASADEQAILTQSAHGQPCEQAAQLLHDVWQRRWWLACGCRSGSDKPPLMHVRLGHTGHYELASMTDRPPHTRDCPFAQPAHAPQASALRASVQDEYASLGGLMARWFKAAGLNELYPYTAADVVSRQYASLRKMARDIAMEPGRKLAGAVCTHPDDIETLLDSLSGQDGAQGENTPGVSQDKRSPWGVVFDVVNEIAGGVVQLGKRRIEVPVTAARMPVEGCDTGGPYALLIRYGSLPGGGVGPLGLFAQPVYSGRYLVPVDYAHERDTLRALLNLQRKMLNRGGVVVVIRKTLPGGQAHARGIAFQIRRLGPNGRAVCELDILTSDVTQLDPERLAPTQVASRPQGVVYHLVKHADSDDARSVKRLHALDRQFYGIVYARLLEGLSLPDGADERVRRVSTSSVHAMRAEREGEQSWATQCVAP